MKTRNTGYKRADRVSRSILSVLAAALRERVSDPALKGVMLTEVRMSTDIKHARVYWYLLKGRDDEKVAVAEAGFERATRLLRSIVGQKLSLKSTPVLKFEYDQGIDDQRRIEQLLADD